MMNKGRGVIRLFLQLVPAYTELLKRGVIAMIRIKLAILENDSNYINRIVSVFNSRFTDKLEVFTFTDKDAAISSLAENRINVFLVSEQIQIDTKEIPDRCAFAYLSESNSIDTIYGEFALGKYQKAEIIYKSILNLFSDKSSEVIGYKVNDTDAARIIAFASCSGGVGSSTVAASCALNFAMKGHKTMYINLEQLGNANIFFNAEGQSDFGDVIYAIKSKKSNLSLKIESTMKMDPRGVYFFDSCKMALDNMEISKDDIERLIRELRTSSFEYVIIDCDFSLNGLPKEIFESVSSVILISDGSKVSNDKLHRSLASLEVLDKQKVIKYLPKVAVMYNRFSNKTSTQVEGLNFNVLGGIQRFEGAQIDQIMQQISTMPIFDKLM